MQIKRMQDYDLSGKKVLVRVDFNVPMDASGKITDDTRIICALPTIKYLIDVGAKIILVSHLGRPNGKIDEKLRMNTVADKLKTLLGRNVYKVDECIGIYVQTAISMMVPGDVMLLENIRFYPQEEANEADFVKELAALADFYVNDAFGTAHRAHASTAGVAELLPSSAGLLMEKEFEFFHTALEHPNKPFTAIVGGAKVSSKIKILRNLIDKVDNLIIGGAMAFTFLKAQGLSVGTSRVENEKLDIAEEIMSFASKKGVRFLLPTDFVAAPELNEDSAVSIVAADNFPEELMGLDIGPKSISLFSEMILDSATILWNGPMGVFEMKPFAEGTRKIAEALSVSRGITIIGGGDSVAAVHQFGFEKSMTHISTGGGSALEMLEGHMLPGIKVLLK